MTRCWRTSSIGSCLFVIVLVQLVCISTASASFFRLTSLHKKVTIDEENKQLKILFSIKNDGDEVPRNVGLSFPSLNQSFILAEEINKGEEVEKELRFSFDDLKISSIGEYSLLYRLTYQDINFYSYSTPHFLRFKIGQAPKISLLIDLENVSAGKALSISDKAKVYVQLQAIGEHPVRIDEIRVFSTSDLLFDIGNIRFPVELKPKELFRFIIDLKNKKAVEGSNYAVILSLSGSTQGKHFVEHSVFQILITPPIISTYNLIGFVLAVISLVLIGKWLIGVFSINSLKAFQVVI